MMEYISEILINAAPYVHFISFGLLILAGLNFPVSEDIVFIISASIAATIIPENRNYIFIGCFTGAYASDMIIFSIGKYLGPKLVKTKFLKNIISDKKINRMENYFEKYGSITLFLGRFVPFGFRNVTFFTAGLVKMRPLKFMLIDVLALSVTSTILFSLGYTFGKNYKQIFPYLNQYKYIILGIVLTIFLVIYFKKKINNFTCQDTN